MCAWNRPQSEFVPTTHSRLCVSFVSFLLSLKKVEKKIRKEEKTILSDMFIIRRENNN